MILRLYLVSRHDDGRVYAIAAARLTDRERHRMLEDEMGDVPPAHPDGFLAWYTWAESLGRAKASRPYMGCTRTFNPHYWRPVIRSR